MPRLSSAFQIQHDPLHLLKPVLMPLTLKSSLRQKVPYHSWEAPFLLAGRHWQCLQHITMGRGACTRKQASEHAPTT